MGIKPEWGLWSVSLRVAGHIDLGFFRVRNLSSPLTIDFLFNHLLISMHSNILYSGYNPYFFPLRFSWFWPLRALKSAVSLSHTSVIMGLLQRALAYSLPLRCSRPICVSPAAALEPRTSPRSLGAFSWRRILKMKIWVLSVIFASESHCF